MADMAKLIRGPVSRHLVAQTAPGIFGVGAIMSTGLVDAYFIGQLGQRELAAVAFIFPVLTALSSLGVGVMVGVSSVVSRALGEGNDERATGRANLGIMLGMFAGLSVGIALYLLRQPLFALMQADAELLPLIDRYMRPYAIGFPILLTMMGLNGVLRGQGAAKSSTTVLIAYAAMNWLLDPILIGGGFGFSGFGIAGAAYATIIGWNVAVVTAFVLVRRGVVPFSPASVLARNWRSSLIALLRVAGPAAFSNSINPVGLAVLTALIATEGQGAVAAFGAGGRVQAFASVPLLAMSGAIGAIVGQNWGAGEDDRARRALWLAVGFCLAYGLASALLLFVLADSFAAMFSDDPAVIREIVRYLHISVWGYAGFGAVITVNGALNAIDRAGFALLLSLSRVALLMVPAAYFLRESWGSTAIYGGELAANLVGGLVSAMIGWQVLRRGPKSPSRDA